MPSLILIAAPAGAQPRLREEVIGALIAKGYTLERRLETAVWADLFEEALTPSLFASLRIFEIDDGKSLGPLPERFVRNVEKGDADAVFLIHSEKPLQKELGAAYKLAHVVPYESAPYWPGPRATWLRNLAKSKGWTLDPAAASKLVEWIEDEEELRSELDKLGRAAGKRRITVSVVDELSVDEGGKALLNLLDAIARADPVNAVLSLSALRDEGELIPTLAAVHRRVRNACLTSDLGDGAAKALRLTNFQAKTARLMAQTYGRDLLPLWLGELIRLSWCERTGDGEGWEGLEKLTLAVISRARPRR